MKKIKAKMLIALTALSLFAAFALGAYIAFSLPLALVIEAIVVCSAGAMLAAFVG